MTAAAAGGAALLLPADGAPDLDCAVEARLLPDPLPELVGRDELTPAGTVGRERTPTVRAFAALPAPFGPVEAGRFLERDQSAPALLPLGERLGLVSDRTVRLVDVPSGDTAWALRLSEPVVRGGLVGDSLTLLVGGPAPVVLTVDPATGEPLACADVPLAGADTGLRATTLVTDQAGPDVVVVAGRDAAPVTLARLPVQAGAEGGWTRELPGAGESPGVRVVGDLVVVSRVTDPVRLGEMAVAGGITTPLVTAYDGATGEPVWDLPGRAATVVADDPGAGTVYAVEVAPGPTRQATRTRATLVALDQTGAELWRRPLGPGLVSGALWGDRLVVQGPNPGGGARLRAFDLDGRPAWELSTPELPFGEQRDNFGPPTSLGALTLVPSPNGLVALDPVTGDARPLNVREPVDDLAVVGDHLVVRSGPALLVMARATT